MTKQTKVLPLEAKTEKVVSPTKGDVSFKALVKKIQPPKGEKKTKMNLAASAIPKPNFITAAIDIKGTSPYVQHAFSQKSVDTMKAAQEAGQQARSKRKRAPKDFAAVYAAAMHVAKQGWAGIPAPAFRNAMISACRTIGFKMTLAKLSVFIEADGFDRADGTPLVRITKGKPREHFAPARNANGGTDIRCRPMWEAGWQARLRVRWDADQFSMADVINLLARAGEQVGIGEGRADSRESNGIGWGSFTVVM